MYELRKLLIDIGIDLSKNDSWQKQDVGACSFCGKHRELSRSSVMKVLTRRSNSAYINFHSASIPAICQECSIVYENITQKNLQSFFQKKKLFVVDIDTQEYRYIESIEELLGLKNISVWYNFQSSNYMPGNCYIREITLDIEKCLWVNVINGTKLYPVLIDLDELKEYKEKEYKEEQDAIMKALRDDLLGGLYGKSKSSFKKTSE